MISLTFPTEAVDATFEADGWRIEYRVKALDLVANASAVVAANNGQQAGVYLLSVVRECVTAIDSIAQDGQRVDDVNGTALAEVDAGELAEQLARFVNGFAAHVNTVAQSRQAKVNSELGNSQPALVS